MDDEDSTIVALLHDVVEDTNYTLYEKDFSNGIIASVNHDVDSDSTGAVAGNILGAITGYNKIDDKWKEKLQFHDLLLDYADQCYQIHYLMK